MSKRYLLPIILLSLAFATFPVFADEYHFKNILIGERAAGLGGAFVAISDDPSGIYYNPAGTAFGLESYLSVSANAYTSSQTRYKDIYPAQDYTYRTQALVPSFFGFTQSLGQGSRKVKFGFAIVVPSSESIDQFDSIEKGTDSISPAKGFVRKFLEQDITYLGGPSLATELADNLAVGISLLGLYRTFKLVDNTTVLFNPVGTGPYFIQNSQVNKNFYALVPKLGIQYMPDPKVSLGLMVQKPFNLGGSGNQRILRTKTDASGNPVTPNGNYDHDMEVIDSGNVFHDVSDAVSLSLGGAYFFSKEWLVTVQWDTAFAHTSFREYPIRTTHNWAVGTEYYFVDWVAGRLAFFSDNARTQEVDENNTDQSPHVNLLGVSTGISMYRSGSSLSLSAMYAFGEGKGQAISGIRQTQVVQQSNLAFYLSGSYQL